MLILLAALSIGLGPSAPFAEGKYRFTCDYETLNTKGQMVKVDRVLATLSVERGTLTWSDATITPGDANHKWSTPVPQKDLEGFSYRVGDDLFKPDFFRGFNDPEFKLKNLTWDTEMFRGFSLDLPKLKRGKSLKLGSSDVPLGGGSTFRNTAIELKLDKPERTGPVVSYFAPGNKVDMKLSQGMALEAISTYSGRFWLRRSDKVILKGTLDEDVAGMVRHTPGGDLPVHVVRKGLFEFLK